MSILRGFKFFQVSLVILISLVSLTTLPLKGYCDDWVFVISNEEFKSVDYNTKSIKIDKLKYIIEVEIKNVYTTKKKNDLLNEYKKDNITLNKYNEIEYQLILFKFNYKEWKWIINRNIFYSKSDEVVKSETYSSEWEDISPEDMGDFILNKILKDYNLQRQG